jgi:hypothetical protein
MAGFQEQTATIFGETPELLNFIHCAIRLPLARKVVFPGTFRETVSEVGMRFAGEFERTKFEI